MTIQVILTRFELIIKQVSLSLKKERFRHGKSWNTFKQTTYIPNIGIRDNNHVCSKNYLIEWKQFVSIENTVMIL